MAGGSGFELAARMRAELRWREIPLLVLTGHDSAASRQRAQAAGFSEYLVKLDREALIAAMDRAVRIREVIA